MLLLGLLTAGQPLITNDLWWHLALGRAYAEYGPLLPEDPLLFTAPGPPTPASWLWALGVHGVEQLAGFTGLRMLHVALASAALGLGFSLLRRASGSLLVAFAGTALTLVLSAYRLAQLRPHLATLLFTLLLFRLLIEGERLPSARRIAIAVGLMALWVNLHAGFLLGPVLLAGGTLGLLAAAPLRAPERRPWDLARARRLGLATLLGLLATLANPGGLDPHLAWFAAGSDTPLLARVGDEWSPVSLLHRPVPTLPPSLLSWSLLWGLVLATPLAALAAVRSWQRGLGAAGVDPARVALALGALAAPFVAVRFLWLAFFPLLLLATLAGRRRTRASPAARLRAAWAIAAALLLLVPGFLRYGDWPMVSRSLPRRPAGWATPYLPQNFYAHSVWLLADAGVTGNAYNDYATGGFLGYWLAPGLKAYLNGTLNVSREVMAANLPIRERRGVRPGESFLELLDRLEIGVFIGIHPPQAAPGSRPWYRTTSHLEGAPGWLPVFRNLRSAVYLRSSPDNAANLERLAAWYAAEGVPFEPTTGFDTARVLREAPDWAFAHGLTTAGFANLGVFSLQLDARGAAALDRLGSIWASLGLYERSLEAARRRLRRGESLAARRRLVWSLLQLGRGAEAREAAGRLANAPAEDTLSGALAEAAERFDRLDAERAAALKAMLPVFTPLEAQQLLAAMRRPEVRPPRALNRPPGAPGRGA